MKSLSFAAVLCAAAVTVSSKFADHMGDQFQYSGSGSLSLGGSPDYHAPLEQIFNYTNGTIYNQTTEINPHDEISEDIVKVSWMWYFKGGYSGRYNSYQSLTKAWKWNFQTFEYVVNFMCNARTSIDIVVYGMYKMTVDIVFDIIDWDILRQQIRWVRPKALIDGSETSFDLAIKPFSGFNKLFDISFLFTDGLNINFSKDLSKTLIDILDLGWNGIRYPENVSEDDTKRAFEMTDFAPSYSSDFSYGGKVGLVPEDSTVNPILSVIRYLKGDQNWKFEVLPLFNWWIFNTRSD